MGENHYRFLFLEPFFGGSHRDFAEGLVEHSRHRIDLITLPSRFWKWRMRGAALCFFNTIKNLSQYDGLIATDLMSLSDFISLCRGSCPPALVYFHESQLTYPLAHGEPMDVHFGFTDITTCLAADRILFNSHTHLQSFLSALPGFLKMMPDYRPDWIVDAIRPKTAVLHPGCRFPEGKDFSHFPDSDPPLIIWNHRWEFDKNPDDFFHALDAVMARGLDFRLALLGENFMKTPKAFIAARTRYGNRILRYGYEKSCDEYHKWLTKGDIVVSTAYQENFGISIVEAIRFGCIPILPFRLAYPEIIPDPFHKDFFYSDLDDLIEKLYSVISSGTRYKDKTLALSQKMDRFSWKNLIGLYDRELEKLARMT